MGFKFLLESLGIDPAQVQQAFEQAKILIPQIAHDFEEIKKRLAVIEQHQTELLDFLEVQYGIKSRTTGKN